VQDMALTREGKTTVPVGVPRQAADVPLPGQIAAPAAAASQALAALTR